MKRTTYVEPVSNLSADKYAGKVIGLDVALQILDSVSWDDEGVAEAYDEIENLSKHSTRAAGRFEISMGHDRDSL